MFKLAPYWRRQFPYDYKLAMLGSWMMLTLFFIFVSSVIDRFGYYLIPIQAMIFAKSILKPWKIETNSCCLTYALLTLVFVFGPQHHGILLNVIRLISLVLMILIYPIHYNRYKYV